MRNLSSTLRRNWWTLVLRGALTVMWLISSYSVLFGIVLVGWGLHLRGLRDDPQ